MLTGGNKLLHQAFNLTHTAPEIFKPRNKLQHLIRLPCFLFIAFSSDNVIISHLHAHRK